MGFDIIYRWLGILTDLCKRCDPSSCVITIFCITICRLCFRWYPVICHLWQLAFIIITIPAGQCFCSFFVIRLCFCNQIPVVIFIGLFRPIGIDFWELISTVIIGILCCNGFTAVSKIRCCCHWSGCTGCFLLDMSIRICNTCCRWSVWIHLIGNFCLLSSLCDLGYTILVIISIGYLISITISFCCLISLCVILCFL